MMIMMNIMIMIIMIMMLETGCPVSDDDKIKVHEI